VSASTRNIDIMNFRMLVAVMGCSLMMLTIPVSQSTGGCPFVWSYRIPLLSASALSDDGERFLVGCENGEYFVFDRYGNLVLNRTFERGIYCVDIAENGNMIFGLENAVVLVDKMGNIKSREYLDEPTLHVSIAKNGLYAVAGTQEEIFLMSSRELMWRSKISAEDSEDRSHRGESSSVTPLEISNVAISAGGSSIAVAAQEKIFLFDLKGGIYKARIDLGSAVTSVVILPDESGVAIGTERGTLSLYTVEGRREFSIPQPGSPTSDALQGSVTSIAANSEQILVGTSENRLYLINRNGSISWNREAHGSVKACDISDDGKVMTVLDSEGNVSFSNTSTGEGWKFSIRNPISAELSEDGTYVGITGGTGIYFLQNWESTIESTGYFPYSSHGSFSLKDDFYEVWPYPVDDNCVFDYGDINGDGRNEVVLGSGTELIVLDYRGELIWKEPFPAEIESVRICDLTGDAVSEIIIGIKDGELDMQVWSGNRELLHPFDFMTWFRVNQEPGIRMDFIAAMDIDQDGAIEILAEVKAEHLLGRRGIFAFEYPSGKEEWFYETGPQITNYVLTDINDDGILELVLGSESPCNGNSIGGRDDAHVYVMAIDLEGKEIWAEEIGGKHLQLFVAVSDLDGDGWKEIVGTVGSQDDTEGRLFILNRNGKCIHEKESEYSMWLGGVADFDKDGFQEILVTDSKGRVVMYDHTLLPLRQLRVGEETSSYVRGVADLDGNGILEIVLVVDQKLMIMDSSLAELVPVTVDDKQVSVAGEQVIVAQVSGCALDLLVHSSNRIVLYSLKYEKTSLCPLIKESLTGYPGIYFERAQTYYINLNFKGAREFYETAKEQYEELGNFGKAIESSRKLERTRSICNAEDMVDDGKRRIEDSERKKTLNDSVEAREWLKTVRDEVLEARILFSGLLEDEEYTEVREWLGIEIDKCESLLSTCEELEEAFESFESGKKEVEEKDYERAIQHFVFALQTFDEYGFEQLSQNSRTFLKEIEEYQMNKRRRMRIFGWTVILSSWTVSLSLIYGSLKYLQDIMYRNENYSALDSLLYTFHIRKKFPEFSVIRNPYYAGIPVRDPSMFFGRKSLHEFLKENLVCSGRNPSIILHGERKTGKTSILFQIENGKLNLGEDFIPVYVDMNRIIFKDDCEFLSILASLIHNAITSHRIQMPLTSFKKEENPYLLFKANFMRDVANSIGEKRIILLVDEYEVIEGRIIEGKLSKDILGFLKSLIEQETKLDFIFAGSRKIDDLKYHDEWSYALNASVYRKISSLKKEDAVRLIKDPVAKKVWFTSRAVRKLLELSGCHPYILQLLCFNLIILLDENKSLAVDTREVEKVMQDVIENPVPQMEYLWERLPKDQQLLVSFLAEAIQKKNGSISQERIIDEFKEKDFRLLKDINATLDDLEEKDILRSKKHRYSFFAEIFRQFIAEHYSLRRTSQ
jgi:WD40 repeat protein